MIKRASAVFSLLLILIASMGIAIQPASAATIPTFRIVSVVKNKTVTIETANFPAHDTFVVRMGEMGTRGVNGIKVDTFKSGKGGTLSATFSIPVELKGSRLIAIRLQSPTSGYYSYNWFYNAPAAKVKSSRTIYKGIPTFSIQSVVRNKTVTIRANNFPANLKFAVLMGDYGTKGIGGTQVTTFNSGTGGSFTKTFTIPEKFKGDYRIAIRLQNSSQGYYAYNWFYNR